MRILLIEDHQDIAANISEYFSARGDVVDHAADGDRGYQLATSQSYDVIVLDLMLPGMDGLTLIREARQVCGNLPVIVLSGMGTAIDQALKDFEIQSPPAAATPGASLKGP